MIELAELQKQYKELDEKAGKYNCPEFDKVYEIIGELVKGRNDVGDKGDLDYPLVTGEVIDEALSKSGFANNKTFVSDFKKYREIEEKARELQRLMIECPDHPLVELKINKKEKLKEKLNTDEWLFYPISIYTPKEMMSIIDNILEKDAKAGKGLYSNITDISEEDESLDEWFDVEAYGVKCSLEPLYRDLQSYGVIDTVLKNDKIKEYYLKAIKNLVNFIRDNTDKPNRIRNHISNTIKGLDDIPAFGLLLQILLLQGLIKWFEGVDLKESDNGYNEACALVQWIGEQLMKKEVLFCFFRWGDEDKEMLKPFCDYLHSHEIGEKIQEECREHIKKNLLTEENEPQPQKQEQSKNLPIELDNDEVKNLLQKAITAGLCDNSYKWVKSKSLLAYLADKISEHLNLGKGEYDGKIKTSWKPFETLFGISGLSGAKRDYQKTGTLPDGYSIVDKLFE